jgi:hypothetical protein
VTLPDPNVWWLISSLIRFIAFPPIFVAMRLPTDHMPELPKKEIGGGAQKIGARYTRERKHMLSPFIVFSREQSPTQAKV